MTTTDSEVAAIFLTASHSELFNQHWPRLKACVEPLTVEQIWWRPNEASNSVGNLILHLNGNLTQWIVNSFSHGEDKRDRPAEFSADGGFTAAELLNRLGATMTEVARVLDRITVEELLAPYEIQGYKTRGLDAIYHVVDHFGIHFGQIAYITKSLTATDLGFHKELNKTGRAK
jgi:uncharacterized damage-inducible protein DinB